MVTAGAVREFLAGVARGGTVPGGAPGLDAEMRRRGAVAGPPDRPELTPVGRHVLTELAVRAYRTDPLGLDLVSDELGRLVAELDSVAHTAEYFLAELGALTPTEAVPYLRISAAGLANRRSSPEELAEAFRNTWGMFEVISGDPRDRLLAAELLVRSTVPPSRLYAAIHRTHELLRLGGLDRDLVATATILHLFPEPSPEGRMEGWKRWRAVLRAPPVAALLAAQEVAEGAERLGRVRRGLQARGAGAADADFAAAILLLDGVEDGPVLDRTVDLATRLVAKLPTPFLAASLLATEHELSAEELFDWVEKAAAIARQRKLAPSDPELYAIAVALVHDLPPGRFAGTPAAARASEEEEVETATVPSLVALHFGLFRAIIEMHRPTGPPASPVRPAAP